MPTQPLPVLSQSAIQDYADCPRRFKLRYLDRLSYPAMESEPALENERNVEEGALFHRLVQQAFLGLDRETLGALAGTPNLARWWQNFVEQGPSLDGYTIYPEYSLSAPLGSFRLTAKYDLVALRDGQALIYDWKTSRHKSRKDRLAARWQTRVYPALLSHSGGFLIGAENIPPETIQMIYWFSEYPGDQAVFTYSAGQFQRDWDALLSLAEEILAAEDFVKADDLAMCKYCTYRSYCDRGVGASLESERGADGDLEILRNIDFEQIGEIAF